MLLVGGTKEHSRPDLWSTLLSRVGSGCLQRVGRESCVLCQPPSVPAGGGFLWSVNLLGLDTSNSLRRPWGIVEVEGRCQRFMMSETRAITHNYARSHAVSTPKQHGWDYAGSMARPTEYDEARVTKALRISHDMDTRLKAAARERGISVNVLINAALDDYLNRLLPMDELLRTA